MMMQTKRLEAILLTVALLLLVPFIAMQFTDEVNWSLFDFVAAGIDLRRRDFVRLGEAVTAGFSRI